MIDFGINMILLSLQISLCYLAGFYFYLSVDMKRKQIVWHILISFIWGGVLANICWQMQSMVQYIWIIIIELGYAYVTVYFFTEGSFYGNVIKLITSAQVASGLLGGLFYLTDPEFMQCYMIPAEYQSLPAIEIAIYDLLIVFVMLLIRPIIVKIFREDENRERFYMIFFWILQISYVQEFFLRLFEDWKKGGKLHVVYHFVLTVLMVVTLSYVAIRSKRRNIVERQKRLQEETERIGQQYEIMMETTKALHMIRHEWNRQMEFIRDAKGYVPSAELLKYVEKLDEKTRHFMMLSLSGNLYLDTVLEYHYTELEKKNIVVEMIIETLKLPQPLIMDLIPMVEDFFQFVLTKVKSVTWCRFSIRRKRKKLVCQMEIGFSNPKEYYKFKWLDVAGNKMWIRQSLSSARGIAEKRDGAVWYHLEKQTLELAEMISID